MAQKNNIMNVPKITIEQLKQLANDRGFVYSSVGIKCQKKNTNMVESVLLQNLDCFTGDYSRDVILVNQRIGEISMKTKKNG
jgi:hypothetical protein